MYIRDWRKSLRSPPSYRLRNQTFRSQFYIAMSVLCVITLIVLFMYIKPATRSNYNSIWQEASIKVSASSHRLTGYNYTYPLTPPIISNGIETYRIGLIADLDTDSKTERANVWRSFYKKGHISYTPSTQTAVVSWDKEEPIEVTSSYALKGRGTELSELVVFNGRLLTFDDRTGIVYEVQNDKLLPWVLLMDGDGRNAKGFKSEWATVKDDVLYVGSMGKEWTTSHGDFENHNPMYVKAISTNGDVSHINWVKYFKVIRESIGIYWPGYMIHESGMWSPVHRRWYFLPRRCSKEKYNETKDEHMGCNVLIATDEVFNKPTVTEIGDHKPTHGFSSFKFLPGSNDEVIVAIKTEEVNGRTATYIMAFTINGKIVMKEEQVPTTFKYEGLEFI